MSLILKSLLTKKEPLWNKIIFDGDSTDLLIQRLKLPIVEDEAADGKGEYIVEDDGFYYVLIKPNLNKPTKLWVILHEVGHHFLHNPVNHKFSKGTKRKMDREANYFAAIALIPTWLIEKVGWWEIEEAYGYPISLIKLRKEIYTAYKH